MPATSLRTFLLFLAATAWLLAGCGDTSFGPDEIAEEVLVDDLDAAGAAAKAKPATGMAPAAASQSTAVPPTSGPVASAPAGVPAVGPARTFIRTINQTLRQNLPAGVAESHAVQELTLSLARDLRAGPAQPVDVAGVAYQTEFLRVRLTQEIAGQPGFTFDSDARTTLAPADAAWLQALPGQGFAFRLNHQGRACELTGFDLILDRCLQALPADERTRTRAALPASPEEALAWYFDDAIGLLPPAPRQIGQQWTHLRQLGGPVPAAVNMRCTLRQLTPSAAEIELAGLVSPTPAPGPSPAGPRDMQLEVRGGRLLGQCQIDLGTGLPVKSQIEQTLDMLVRLPDGTEFEQSKTSLSTLILMEPPAVASPGTSAAGPTALR